MVFVLGEVFYLCFYVFSDGIFNIPVYNSFEEKHLNPIQCFLGQKLAKQRE